MQAVSDIILWAEISQYLAANAIKRGGLWGDGIPANLPRLLYMVRKNVQRQYDLDPTDDTLPATASYLFTLCGKFGLQAMGVSGNSGTIAGLTPPSGSIYPFAIGSSDFEADGTSYNNPDIVGDNLMIFINEWTQQWLFSPASFIYTATGIQIVLGGFDANTFDYTIVIQKKNNG